MLLGAECFSESWAQGPTLRVPPNSYLGGKNKEAFQNGLNLGWMPIDQVQERACTIQIITVRHFSRNCFVYFSEEVAQGPHLLFWMSLFLSAYFFMKTQSFKEIMATKGKENVALRICVCFSGTIWVRTNFAIWKNNFNIIFLWIRKFCFFIKIVRKTYSMRKIHSSVNGAKQRWNGSECLSSA